MSLTDTLARVDADLAAGRIPVARQRLRGLVTSYPCDSAVRRRLAEVYRLYGEPAEAGRWMYLEADRDPAETAAFEARYRTPEQRLRALAWRGPEEEAGTAFAVEQLTAVRNACSRAEGRPGGEESSVRDTLAGFGCLLLVLAMAAIWVNGLVALFE